MKLAEWSNTTILALGREWDISASGEFDSRARRDEIDPRVVKIDVRNVFRGRKMTFTARQIRADVWMVENEDGETLLAVFTPGDEWPWRLRAAAIMLWINRNGK